MYAYSWVTRGVNVLADVLPTGPIRISYNKFCYYAENRHFFAPQFDSINNIKTLHIYEYIYFQFVFYEAQLKQLHVWCVSIAIATPATAARAARAARSCYSDVDTRACKQLKTSVQSFNARP